MMLSAPQILKAIFYQVPQKRERLLIIGLKGAWICAMTISIRKCPIKDVLKKRGIYMIVILLAPGQAFF